MKQRVVKKVEKRMLVDKVCDLQREICEYDRFIGDLVVMLSKGQPKVVLEHKCHELAGWVWDLVYNLIQDNNELKEKLRLAGIDFEGEAGKAVI